MKCLSWFGISGYESLKSSWIFSSSPWILSKGPWIIETSLTRRCLAYSELWKLSKRQFYAWNIAWNSFKFVWWLLVYSIVLIWPTLGTLPSMVKVLQLLPSYNFLPVISCARNFAVLWSQKGGRASAYTIRSWNVTLNTKAGCVHWKQF